MPELHAHPHGPHEQDHGSIAAAHHAAGVLYPWFGIVLSSIVASGAMALSRCR
jgi:hypothetical protein